jgi:phage portal protein BeeE
VQVLCLLHSPAGTPQTDGVTRPYEHPVWAYACINAIAQSISGAPLLLKNGTRKDPKILELHSLADLFDAPNARMSVSQFLEATFVFLGLTGEAFFLLE